MLFGVLNSSQVESKFVSISDRIKSKATGVFLSVKTKALYVLSWVRESDQDKIKKALAAKNAMVAISEELYLGVGGEEELLKNIQSLGLEKKNALSALKIIEKHHVAMRAIEGRYGFLRKNSLEMEETFVDILPFLKACALYKLYFESHKDCLKGWELVERYGGVDKVDITDIKSAISAISLWYKNNDTFHLVKSFDLLISDIVYIKACLRNKSYQQAYPNLYGQLYSFLPTLECVADQVKMSAEYASEWFYKTNKPTPSSKKAEIVQKPENEQQKETVVVSCDDKKEGNPWIQRMNPFHDFEIDQD